jgi:anaerobic magnesium-protoporphyrin IX monomethyl ester cyclase
VREAGRSVALFDAMLAVSEDEWRVALDQARPRVAVIYEDSFNYLSKMCLQRMRQAAVTMVAAAHERGVRVVVAGSDASDHPAPYLDAGADIVVVGEGERTLVAVLEAFEDPSGLSLTKVDGICLRGPAGLIRTPPRQTMRHLDDLPRPAWDLVDVDRYRTIWQRRHGYFSMNVATTRGCPYHCNWCAKPIYGQRYVARSPQAVADEIAWLRSTYRPDHLWIADDIFGLKPGWIEAFANEITGRGAVVPFRCLLRADGVTPQITAALVAAGCQTVWIGAESGSQRVLDAMEKGVRVEQIESATATLRAAGIQVGFFLQFGYPGEQFEDIEATLAMVRRLAPDDIGVSVSYPLPGTPFYERVKAQLGTKQHWTDSSDLALLYRGTFRPEFYRRLHALVHAEFRARKAKALVRQLARRPRSIGLGYLKAMLSGALHGIRQPVLRWSVRRLALSPAIDATPAPLPHLSREAAAMPSPPSPSVTPLAFLHNESQGLGRQPQDPAAHQC